MVGHRLVGGFVRARGRITGLSQPGKMVRRAPHVDGASSLAPSRRFQADGVNEANRACKSAPTASAAFLSRPDEIQDGEIFPGCLVGPGE